MLTKDGCPSNVLAIKDALEVMDGRWKLPVLIAISQGYSRFGQLSKEVKGISDKMLSKELKALEANKLIERKVSGNETETVTYSITPHGISLEKLMENLYQWGMEHRRLIIGG